MPANWNWGEPPAMRMDENEAVAKLAERRTPGKPLTKLSEARKVAGVMAREGGCYVQIDWDPNEGTYVLRRASGPSGRAIETVGPRDCL